MNFRKKKIVVTGGAGFIGSHLVKKLVDLGASVTVIDNLSRGKKENLSTVLSQITFHQADLRIEQEVSKYFEVQEVVINLAALNTGVDFDEGRTQLMFEENMLLQLTPLRIAGRTPSIKKFLQVSSASIYSREAMEQRVPTIESDDKGEPEPSKLGYGLAKKMGEHLAKWYAENSKMQTISARFINVYGENDHTDNMGHFIPMMIRKILDAKTVLHVFGSGKQKRSFIYVDDVVSALLTLLEKGASGEVYNVDAEQEKSVIEIVTTLLHILGKPNLNIHYDLTKPEGSQRRMLDATKLRSLGWKPSTSLEEGLKKTVLDIQKSRL